VTIDKLTKRWIKNAADERAAESGCRMDEARGIHMMEFVQEHLRLYEGEYAGQPVHIMDWQQELFMRLFGWVRFSEDWGREVRRFKVCSLWVPKKNGKSPTAAMVGLYLMAADGEQGQKVYSAAKDGKQAQIVHTHARMMVQQSPVLTDLCTVNRATGVILYHPTNSTYQTLSGDNISGQEGLNGSVIIDETHVVDSRLASVLEYMGASRAEPIRFEVSTAGNNPNGYGKRQWDYGEAVNKGEVIDDEFLYMSYSAPQGANDSKCGKPKIWQQANPSWGHTIKSEEFRTSYERAKRSLTDFKNWKMYRLNVWATSTNVWLRQSDWKACGVNYTLDDLEGSDCYLALDLSKTRDMTAAVACFPQDDGSFRFWPWFWLPKETAEQNNHKAPYLEWANAGHLELTEGNVIDYSRVEATIEEIGERFNVLELAFDPMYAEELTQRVEDATGIPRVQYRQTIVHYAGPTAEFERLVMSGGLQHPKNPILSWQAGNVEIKTDVNLNKRPVKPKADNHRKIDGIVAAIMALGRAISTEQQPNYDFYESNTVELI
tara:strand:+ start:974 stop:2614 length:1641 start_codon:yes stop_codon:yes gene_type:complete